MLLPPINPPRAQPRHTPGAGPLADARRGQLLGPVRPSGGVSFAEAAEKWLRYVEHDSKRRPSTVRDYRIVVDPVLVRRALSYGDRSAYSDCGVAPGRALVATAAYAGLRLGELRALRWRDIDFDKRLVHVRRSYVERSEGVPKSGRVRSVPMIDQVARVLDQLSRREWWCGGERPRLLQ